MGQAARGIDPSLVEKQFKQSEAIINSMTLKERRDPDILNASRRRRIAAGRSSVYSFRIVDRDGVPVTDVVTRHERELHLIVASRDLERFHHLHPIRDEHGTWTVELPPLEPATYRVYADLQPLEADPITLGVDLFTVAGLTPYVQGRAEYNTAFPTLGASGGVRLAF